MRLVCHQKKQYKTQGHFETHHDKKIGQLETIKESLVLVTKKAFRFYPQLSA